ncbi:MAG: hypothetical protein ACR2RB_01445 [Gammaproteobacteria bacterium]
MESHRIIALWCHPRSMSTAVERIMRERGDFSCFHEPFMYYYYVHLGAREMPHFDVDATKPTDFDGIVAYLSEAARSAPVFFKDMSYYVVPALFERVDLASRMTHVFLIRDPRKAILSYHKLDPGMQLDEIGLEAQWRQVEWLRKQTRETPIVVEAEAIQKDPQGVLGRLWQSLDLPFTAHAFEWQTERAPEDWQQVAAWHESTARRRRIETGPVEDDATIQAQFDETSRDAPHLREYFHHHWSFYEKLKRITTR